MNLVQYKVNKFRSVKGTDWITVDQLACFVGVNESGKTNLLLPLWKFNPADGATKIDLLHDYPRDEFSQIDKKSALLDEHFVEVLFELEDDEVKMIERVERLAVEKAAEEQSDKERTNQEFSLGTHLVIKKDYKERFYIYRSNDKGELLSEDLEQTINEETFNKLCDLIPRFVYYSEYGNLDSDLYLPHVKDNLARLDSLSGKERMKARTLKILFGHLGLDPDEIMSLGAESSFAKRSCLFRDSFSIS